MPSCVVDLSCVERFNPFLGVQAQPVPYALVIVILVTHYILPPPNRVLAERQDETRRDEDETKHSAHRLTRAGIEAHQVSSVNVPGRELRRCNGRAPVCPTT